MFCALLGATIASAITSTPANADPEVEAFQAISAAYVRCDLAAASRDVLGTLAIDTANYQIVNANGKVYFHNGPEMIAQYKKTYEAVSQVRQKTNLQKLTLQPGFAKATVIQRLQLSAIDPQVNKWRTWIIDWKMEDIWVREAGIWKRKRSVMLNQTSTKRLGQASD